MLIPPPVAKKTPTPGIMSRPPMIRKPLAQPFVLVELLTSFPRRRHSRRPLRWSDSMSLADTRSQSVGRTSRLRPYLDIDRNGG
jgi:hypothetical protein